MTSLWRDLADPVVDEPLPAGDVLDDVIVGAGITGLTTALLLARGGRRVAVVEARTVGALATGGSTAKLSLLQGTKLTRMLGFQSRRVVQAYVDGNLEGQQWLLRFCDDHAVPYQRRDAVTFAATTGQRADVDDELRAALALGLPARGVGDLDVPFPHHGGVLLPDQAQLDPLELLAALGVQLREHGGSLHQGHRVTGVSRGDRCTVALGDGTTLRAEHVVLATGSPILDRGLYFAKLEPMRSYALAFDLPVDEAPDAMFLSAGAPQRSVRDAPVPAVGTRLLVGGNGHPVGRVSSERRQVDDLRAWTARYYPSAVETHAWSAQDYRSHDSFPYVGPMLRGGGRIYVATGFDKWGMSSGAMAARSISAEILGILPSWQHPMRRRVTRPSGLAHGVLTNAKVGVAAAVSTARAESRSAPKQPAEGTGDVGRRSLVVPTGVSTVEGSTCAVVALCTHLGGVLKWNDQERSWDCPLHGSRFTPDGAVIEGPATRPLRGAIG